MIRTQREIAADKWVGPDSNSGQMYDVLKLMDALFFCRDAEIVHRALRVCRHVLKPIQKELQEQNESRYYDEAYGTKTVSSGGAQ